MAWQMAERETAPLLIQAKSGKIFGLLLFHTISQYCSTKCFASKIFNFFFQNKFLASRPDLKIDGSRICSQYPSIRSLLGQGTPGCYLTNIRSSIFGWVYWLSRLIASRLELRVCFPSYVNSLYLLCYVLHAFCSAVSWFCWQTTC